MDFIHFYVNFMLQLNKKYFQQSLQISHFSSFTLITSHSAHAIAHLSTNTSGIVRFKLIQFLVKEKENPSWKALSNLKLSK